MKNNRSAAAGHLSALFCILVWGTTFISTKVLLADFSPVEILVLRFTMGFIVLFIAYPKRLKTASMREELLFAGAGLCGVTMYFLLENVALTYTLASNVGVIVSVAPFFTGILSHFLLKGERLHRAFLMGFVIAITGVFLIGYNTSQVLKLNPVGDLLALLASFSWALYSTLMRKIQDLHYNNIACTRRVFLYGLIFMVPALFLMDFNLDFSKVLVPVNLMNLLFLGLFASAQCFVFWNWAVGILGAVKTSLYIYIVPVVTLIAAALLLNETITPTALLGSCLALAGMFLAERRKKQTQAKGNQPNMTDA